MSRRLLPVAFAFAFAACDAAPVALPATDGAVDALSPRDASADAPPDCVAGDAGAPYALSTERLTVGGLARSYVLAAPPNPCRRPLAVVFVFHGDGGAADRTRNFLRLEDTTAGDAIVVYADGLPIAGSPSTWDLVTEAPRNRELAFFDAMLADLRARFAVDPRRVFAMGLSRGGYFTNQLGCYRGDVLRAIAPCSGGGPNDVMEVMPRYEESMGNDLVVCPTPAVSAMVIHGLADTNVLPAEGRLSSAYWEHFNGCGVAHAATTPAPCEAAADCRPGQRVLGCFVSGLGHLYWPEVRTAAWGFFEGFRE